MRILLVDDDPAGRLVLETIFRHAGWDIDIADNGRIALERAAEHAPDIVISDVLMPEMDGYRLCAEWHRDSTLRDIPFIFLTAAYNDPEDEAFGRSLGADLFITKPIDTRSVISTVMGVIMNHVPATPGGTDIIIDEPHVLREHNERLVAKLESTVVELETANRNLARYHLLFQHANDIMLFISPDGHIVDANPAAVDAYGRTLDELVGLALDDLSAEDLTETGLVRLGQLSTPDALIETSHVRIDGSTFPVEVSAFDAEYRGEPVLVEIVRDITDRKRAESELAQSVLQLQETLLSVVHSMAKIVETRDPYTAGHQERVSYLSHAIAHKMGLDGDVLDSVQIAGLVHDIGKVAIPSEILTKPGAISDIEFALIKEHVKVSYDILRVIAFPWPIAEIARQHHERLDGSGYPQGLKGTGILLQARILAVADVVEAMTFHRPYKAAQGLDKAIEEIVAGRGMRYDPDVCDACVALFIEDGFRFQAPDPQQTAYSTSQQPTYSK